jgi:hypothetical protein
MVESENEKKELMNYDFVRIKKKLFFEPFQLLLGIIPKSGQHF